MCVKFRPAWADKGANIQAGGPRLASCPSSQEPWSLICRGTKESGDERKPTPTPFCPGEAGAEIRVLLTSLWASVPSLLRSRTHSVQHPVQTKLGQDWSPSRG